MIQPLQQNQAFLADVRSAAQDGIHLWWLGQSGFLLKCGSHLALLDPYLSDSLSIKYAKTDKPHVRMSEKVIDPGLLTGVALATSSHNHTDHLDADTLVPLIRANGPGFTLVGPEANREFIFGRLGVGSSLDAASFQFAGIDAGQTVQVACFSLTAVPAAHEQIDRDDRGRHRTIGLVVRCGGKTIYHSGDTMLYDGMVETLRPFAVDVALMPINGKAPERRVAGNTNGREAAWLAQQIGAKLVIPHHYDMFEFNTADPAEQFVPECERIGQGYRVMQLGERVSL